MNESVISGSTVQRQRDDSPTAFDTTAAAQWRVPPNENHQTVDIFLVPEYSQVRRVGKYPFLLVVVSFY